MARRSIRLNGFTLVELLTVLAVIVVLIALLLPALRRATVYANLLQCESNLRQLGMAVQMYVNDNKETLPFSNWMPNRFFRNANTGWLFATPLNANPSPADVRDGLLWPYLLSEQVYRCPVHDVTDTSMFGGKSDILTSYMMNGAVNGYGASAGPAMPPTNLPSAYMFKIGRFLPDDVLIWEADERGRYAWNDGASAPTQSYNPTDPYYAGSGSRHGKMLNLLSMDGHVESMNIVDYWALASSPLKNRLWCRPDTATGR